MTPRFLQLGEHVQPVFGALAAAHRPTGPQAHRPTGPQAQDVALPLAGDRQSDVDGPVRDLPVADLEVDGVDEQHRVDGAKWPVLPLGHGVEDLVGDRRDGLAGDLGAGDLGQVRLGLAGGEAFGRQGDDWLVDPGEAFLPLRHDLGFEGAVGVAGQVDLHRADVGEHGLGAVSVAGVAAVWARDVVAVVAPVVGELALERGSERSFGQLLQQQPALAGELQPARAGPGGEPVHQQHVDRVQLGLLLINLGRVPSRQVRHRRHLQDQELHRSPYSPVRDVAVHRSGELSASPRQAGTLWAAVP